MKIAMLSTLSLRLFTLLILLKMYDGEESAIKVLRI